MAAGMAPSCCGGLLVRQWFVFILLVVSMGVQALDLRIASWNIERLGHGNQKSYAALAVIADQFDFIAVQEAMTQEGVARLRSAVEEKSRERWEVMYSHRLGPGSHKEKYAFLWRVSAVEYVDAAVVYLDPDNHFVREPYSARFRSRHTGDEFVAATVHILYGSSQASRLPEIHALREYWDWLDEVYPDTALRFLMGDFNLPPQHPAWAPLKEVARPLIWEGASTLSAVNGRFANLYDNIWLPRSLVLTVAESGVYQFPMLMGWSHEKSRRHISDHAPVYARVGDGAAQVTAPAQPVMASPATTTETAPAIRGNLRSKLYHRADCSGFHQIAERNIAVFVDEDEAKAAGFRRAGNCP